MNKNGSSYLVIIIAIACVSLFFMHALRSVGYISDVSVQRSAYVHKHTTLEGILSYAVALHESNQLPSEFVWHDRHKNQLIVRVTHARNSAQQSLTIAVFESGKPYGTAECIYDAHDDISKLKTWNMKII